MGGGGTRGLACCLYSLEETISFVCCQRAPIFIYLSFVQMEPPAEMTQTFATMRRHNNYPNVTAKPEASEPKIKILTIHSLRIQKQKKEKIPTCCNTKFTRIALSKLTRRHFVLFMSIPPPYSILFHLFLFFPSRFHFVRGKNPHTISF